MSLAQSARRTSVSSHVIRKRNGGLRSLAFAIVLALGAIPTAVWAKAPVPGSAEVSRTRPASAATHAPTTADPRSSQQAYAAREASAISQEKFEGGDSTIWIGGSTVVIVLLVVLIAVLI